MNCTQTVVNALEIKVCQCTQNKFNFFRKNKNLNILLAVERHVSNLKKLFLFLSNYYQFCK